MAEGVIWHLGAAIFFLVATWHFLSFQTQKKEMDEAILPVLLCDVTSDIASTQPLVNASQMRRALRFLQKLFKEKFQAELCFSEHVFKVDVQSVNLFRKIFFLTRNSKDFVTFAHALQLDFKLDSSLRCRRVRVFWDESGATWNFDMGESLGANSL